MKALIEVYRSSDGPGPDWKRWQDVMAGLENHPGWSRKISMNTARRRCQVLLEGADLTRDVFAAGGPDACLTFPNQDSAIEACLVIRDALKDWLAWPAICDGSYRLPLPNPVPAAARALTIQPIRPEASADDVQIIQARLSRMEADQKAHEIRITRLERRKK